MKNGSTKTGGNARAGATVAAQSAAIAEVTTLTIHIPVSFRRRGGRKLVLAPDGVSSPVAPKPAVDDTMVKMLVKAHRWRRRIESGAAKSVTDLAEQEKVTIPYVTRVLARRAWPRTSWPRSSTVGSRGGCR